MYCYVYGIFKARTLKDLFFTNPNHSLTLQTTFANHWQQKFGKNCRNWITSVFNSNLLQIKSSSWPSKSSIPCLNKLRRRSWPRCSPPPSLSTPWSSCRSSITSTGWAKSGTRIGSSGFSWDPGVPEIRWDNILNDFLIFYDFHRHLKGSLLITMTCMFLRFDLTKFWGFLICIIWENTFTSNLAIA